MNKELQDLAWNCLPKEFKEEVKKLYANLRTDEFEKGCGYAFETLFGYPNLTSCAEGEEMLCVSRARVQKLYNRFEHAFDNAVSDNLIGHYREKIGLLKALFGSKCLPDEACNVASSEPKPTEPKFKVGDTASYVRSPALKYKCTVTKVMQNEYNDKWEYNVMFERGKSGMRISESDLEPYTEPKETILKDSFRNERRLNIAAIAMRGILNNPDEVYSAEICSTAKETPKAIAEYALALADALLAECEKGGLQ